MEHHLCMSRNLSICLPDVAAKIVEPRKRIEKRPRFHHPKNQIVDESMVTPSLNHVIASAFAECPSQKKQNNYTSWSTGKIGEREYCARRSEFDGRQ
jgi:hypothetical protein